MRDTSPASGGSAAGFAGVADDFSDGIAFYDCEKGIRTGKTFANGGSGPPKRGSNFVAPISHEEPAQAIHRAWSPALETSGCCSCSTIRGCDNITTLLIWNARDAWISPVASSTQTRCRSGDKQQTLNLGRSFVL